MASGGEVAKDTLISAIRDLKDVIEQLFSQAKNDVRESVQQFIEEKISKLFGLASAYKKTFERLDVQTRDEFDNKVKQFFRYSEVQEIYGDLQEIEGAWDDLLKDVDLHLEQSGPQPLTKGQIMELEEPLVDARSGDPTCLKNLFMHQEAPVSEPKQSSQGQNQTLLSTETGATSLVVILLRHFA